MEEFAECGLELWLEHEFMQGLWNAMINIFRQTCRLEFSLLTSSLDGMPAIKSLAMKLSRTFPPGENPENISAGLKKYCLERKKKALRLHVLEDLKVEGETQDAEILLKKFQQLL